MKIYALALLCILGVSAHSQSEKQYISIKAELKTGQLGYTGHGPLVMFNNTNDQNSLKKTEFEINGVPEDWVNWYRKEIWFQSYQWVYQNYKQGKIDSVLLAELMGVWNFDTLPGEFTSQEIESVTTLIFRKTKDEKVQFYIDSDLDHNFSDEQIQSIFPQLKFHQVDSILPYAPLIDYELYLNGKVERHQVPFVLEKYGKWMLYTMPVYAEAILGEDTLIVNTVNPDFKEIQVSRIKEIDVEAKRFEGQRAEPGTWVKYSNQWYIVDHFDRAGMELVLEVVDTTQDSISATKGFYAPDFEFDEMISHKSMKLSDLKGKYVLLDFWGTWCKPCVAGIPDLVRLKNDLSEEPFEIVSIAVSSDLESFRILQEKHGMNWFHAWLRKQSGVVDEYKIHSYPTFVLLDPEGKVIDIGSGVGKVKQHVLVDNK